MTECLHQLLAYQRDFCCAWHADAFHSWTSCLFVCFFNNFIYLLLTVLGLPCCAGFLLVAVSGGCSLVEVHRLIIAIASLLAERGLQL